MLPQGESFPAKKKKIEAIRRESHPIPTGSTVAFHSITMRNHQQQFFHLENWSHPLSHNHRLCFRIIFSQSLIHRYFSPSKLGPSFWHPIISLIFKYYKNTSWDRHVPSSIHPISLLPWIEKFLKVDLICCPSFSLPILSATLSNETFFLTTPLEPLFSRPLKAAILSNLKLAFQFWLAPAILSIGHCVSFLHQTSGTSHSPGLSPLADLSLLASLSSAKC